MINFPFFRYKYPGFYYPYYDNYIKKSYQTFSKQKDNIENEQYYTKNKKTSTYNSFGPIRFNNGFLDGDFENPIIEILGIELYLDDLILIGLLFLLYNENIQDEILFISLIILLLS